MRYPSLRDPKVTIGEQEIAQAIAADSNLESVQIDTLDLDADLIESKISRPFARRHRMIPLSMINGRLRVACANPFDIEGIDAFRRIAGRDLQLVVASEPDILRAITEFYGLRHSVKRAERDLSAGIDLGNLEQLVRMKNESEIESSDQHIVNAVEFMLQHAFDTRASDIHVEPKRDFSLIRFRIDGVLHDIQSIPKIVHAAILSRLKTLSRLDIAEKRRPQDGRIKTTRAGKEIELRVSTLPVAFGEKIVMRIFDPDVLMQDLSGLGFYPEETVVFNEFITPARTASSWSPARPAAARPPPSTRPSRSIATPRAQHHHHRRPDRDGARGVQPDRGPGQDRNRLRRRAAPHPAPGSRRHHGRRDPRRRDGAVRDPGRAHRPPGLLHPAHQRRLDFDLAAHRPRRRALPHQLDPHRRDGAAPGAQDLHQVHHRAHALDRGGLLAAPHRAAGKKIKVKEGQGCHDCRGTGYLGRCGIFEILPIDESIKHLIVEGKDAPEIKREAVKNGMRTLRQSALRKLAEGATTFEEVVRVTGL